MKLFPRGSEWRKWDLHVHPPGTKLSDGYQEPGAELNWDRFCKIIYESDVQALGIADYFSLDGFFSFKEEYERRYPSSEKVLFPNLELRLNEAVNRAGESVHFHVIFRPNLTQEKAAEFLQRLNTLSTDTANRHTPCSELAGQEEFEKATVSREAIQEAIEGAFGDKVERSENAILIAAVNADGIRAGGGNKRRMELSDQIDKFTDAFFGNPTNTTYFLNPDRLEAEGQKVASKPVFSGCDAHSFEQLEGWLGKECTDGNAKHVTWIKADLTFEGLQQTLIEPSERVRIQLAKPDKKEPYKVISRVVFSNSDKFPREVRFNPGLNSIIGPRSSGKSALLAYVAHSVDPDYTERQQYESGGEVGPGAGLTWDDVADLEYAVEWEADDAEVGRVIYVPQNALFSISRHTDKITEMIRPTAFRCSAEFQTRFARADTAVRRSNDSIRDAVDKWFSLLEEAQGLEQDKRGLGDRKAIAGRDSELKEQIEAQQKEITLSVDDVARYEQILRAVRQQELLLEKIAREEAALEPYVQAGDEGHYETTDIVEVGVTLVPALESLPDALRSELERDLNNVEAGLLRRVKSAMCGYRSRLDAGAEEARERIKKIRAENSELIKKGEASRLVDTLIRDRQTQTDTLAAIDEKAKQIAEKNKGMDKLLWEIQTEVKKRDGVVSKLVADFNGASVSFERLRFTVEADFDEKDTDRVSRGFNKTESSEFITTKPDTDQRVVDVEKAISEPGEFVKHMGSGRQKVNQGESAIALTKDVLTLNRDMRFVATLEGDRIGGFESSTMTPGKQALFALTLILARSDEPWPLLIDQPEDDLDNRAVCETIVEDLKERKRERQIIMVSHDANLVIGADSEEIIVANRHGADRPNKDERMFEYLTGAIEHSEPKSPSAKTILASAGIREHACEILDGGEEAFEKRKRKYRI
jgi:ABC-type uncharacterized transport system YnjBCD ATPase subunit